MKVKTVFIVLLLSITQFTFSQTKFRIKNLNADSLAAILPEKKGTELVEVLNLLSNVLCKQNIDSSQNLASLAIHLSEELDYKKGLADGYFNLGNTYFFQDDFHPTILNYLKALRIYEDLTPSEEYANLCMQLSLMNFLTDRVENSVKYSIQALELYDRIDDNLGRIDAYISQEVSYLMLNECDSAQACLNRALIYLERKPDPNILAAIYNEFGIVYKCKYYNTGDTNYLNMAISSLKKSLAIKNTDLWRTESLYQYGTTLLEYGTKQKYSEGVSYLQKCLLQSQSGAKNIKFQPMIYRLLGWENYLKGNIDSALLLAHKAIVTIDDQLSTLSIVDYEFPKHAYYSRFLLQLHKQVAHNELHTYYSQKGNYKQSLEHFTISKKVEEEIYMKKNQDLLALLEAESEDEKSKNQIAILAKENEVKELKINQSQIFIYGLVGIFLVIILLGLLFMRQNKMKNEHKTVVLEQKLLRLQMNPHFIFNALSNIMNFIEEKNNESAVTYLSSFSKLLRTSLESSRQDYIYLEQEISAIRNYLELQKLRFEDKFRYAVHVDEQLDPENVSIPPMLIQPFIENAIEHGVKYKEDTGHIDVRFLLKDRKIICEVEDNGIGREKAWETKFKKDKTHKSLATSIIADRIQAINKKLKQKIRLDIIDLKSANNEPLGTKVVLDVPIVYN